MPKVIYSIDMSHVDTLKCIESAEGNSMNFKVQKIKNIFF